MSTKPKKKQSEYMKTLSTAPIKGLSSEHIPLKKHGLKKPKSIFAR